MKIRKKLGYIVLFFIMSFSIFAAKANNGMGDLHINMILNPVGKTRLYSVDGKTVLDTGVYNTQDPTISNQVIAKVNIIMEAKPGSNDASGGDHCTIDGDFNGLLKYRELANAVENTSIPLKLKKYYGADKVDMILKSKNYKDNGTIIVGETTDTEYAFTAYPTECGDYNMITKLSYSFDLVLDINNIKNGDIVGGELEIKAEAGKGAIRDLVLQHMNKIMTGN